MSTVPPSSCLRLLPELQQLRQQWACGASVEDVLPRLVGIDKRIVYVRQQPVGSQLDAAVAGGS